MSDARTHAVACLLATLAGLAPSSATAEEPPPRTALDAARYALERDPAHQAVLAGKARSEARLAGARARFVPTLTAGLDYSRATTTSLGQQGVLLGDADLVTARAGVAHRFPWGTSIAADLGVRVDQRAFVSPILNAPLRIGPGYALSLRVTAIQPLLRGLGEDLGRLPEAEARVAADAAGHAVAQAASERVRDALTAFGELQLARATIAVREEALAVARKARDEARLQVEVGALGPPDALPLEAEVAAAEEALVAAQVDVTRRELALARVIGWPLEAASRLVPDGPPTRPREAPDVEALVAAARANAVTLAEREAGLARAELALVAARDRLRLRLDATTWIEAAGLGDRDPVDALGMWGGLEAVSAFVGLELELPTDRTSLLQEVAALGHARDEARLLRDAEARRVEAEVRAAVETWRGALWRQALAARTADASEQAAAALAQRLAAGATTTLAWLGLVREAHAARLRVEALGVEARAAELAALHLSGELLDQLVAP
jgi:outer membrane protein TolC